MLRFLLPVCLNVFSTASACKVMGLACVAWPFFLASLKKSAMARLCSFLKMQPGFSLERPTSFFCSLAPARNRPTTNQHPVGPATGPRAHQHRPRLAAAAARPAICTRHTHQPVCNQSTHNAARARPHPAHAKRALRTLHAFFQPDCGNHKQRKKHNTAARATW